jgi:hypothetical protein
MKRDWIHVSFAAAGVLCLFALAFGVDRWMCVIVLGLIGASYWHWVKGKTPHVTNLVADEALTKQLLEIARTAEDAAKATQSSSGDLAAKLEGLTQAINQTMGQYALQQDVLFKLHGLDGDKGRHKPMGTFAGTRHKPQGQGHPRHRHQNRHQQGQPNQPSGQPT